MLVHELYHFRLLINLLKASPFKVLCLFIKVIDFFAKKLCLFGVLYVGHDCQKLHQKFLFS